MEKKIEKRDHCVVAVCIKASGEEWSKQVKKEFNKKASKVTIPGFRPGKAPANMIASRVNRGEVYGDACLALANVAFKEAVVENKLQPWSEPKLAIKNADEKEMECEVVFCTQPELTFGQYTGLNIPCEEVKVSAKEVSDVVNGLLKEHAVMQVKEGKAKEGDSVIIDFKGYVDDKPFDGGSAKSYELELGSHSFVPGFEEQLVGVKAGDKKVVEVKFPENYVASLKGKDAKFDVEVLDVKEKILPELNEEFFAELNIEGVKDEASLKAHAKKQVQANKEAQAKNAQVEKIVNTAIDNCKVNVPESLIVEEEELNFKEIKKQVEDAGLTYEDYVAINGLKEEELRAKRLEEAERNLKAMIVVENIIAKEGLNVTDKDLDEEYARVAEMYKMDVANVKSALEANKEGLVRQLRNKKFSDFMLAHNEDKVEVKEEKKPATKKAATKKVEENKEEKPAAKKPAAKKTTKKVSE